MLDLKAIKVKKGFTLIEMIVTMAILFMTLAIVSPLLNYNLKSLYTTENKNDLQREAQNTMDYLTKSSMEAQKITVLKDVSSKDILANPPDTISENGISVSEIEFSTPNIETVSEGKAGDIRYNFKLNNETLTYTRKVTTESAIEGDSPDILKQTHSYIYNIKSIMIKPSNDVVNFNSCKGLKITIQFSKPLAEHDITSEVKFRNWKYDSK